MSVVIHFSKDLSAWLVEGIEEGRPVAALVRTMVEENMAPGVAQAIVDAFLAARRAGRPVPVDAVTVDEDQLGYVQGTPILRSENRVTAFDRSIRVLARGSRPVWALFHSVTSAEECARVIELARPRLAPSTVVDPKTGRDVVADYRTSLGMFFRPRENELIARLDRRFSALMNLPEDNGEGLHVLHYPRGASSAPHFDFLIASNEHNRASIARSGQRVSTLVTYLNDVKAGGETVFPKVGFSTCPEAGNAVYFEYANDLGQVDEDSLHASNAVLEGEKWVLTKWMRQRRFQSAQRE